ncbi:LysR family transcriptional regulator [Brevibacillus borstelensis]|uniref:LysR family transcriptional regulator n=1 Tax=Brevibacillus borstelensis TaxID=45462 RepID=UPI0030BF8C7F
MNLHALRIFVEVASKGNVTAAAASLSISQPAVSAQIRKLEAELGKQLLAPKGRGIVLTDEGQFLFSRARRIFDWEKELEAEWEQLKSGLRGKLRLASTFLPSLYLVPAWLAAFKRRYQQVDVEIRTGNSQQSLHRLLRHQADVAVIANESWDDEPIRREHIANVEYWFVVPRDHLLAGQEVPLQVLMREPFLLRENGSSTRERLFSLCREHGVAPPKVGLQYHGLVESVQSVKAGYGAMLAPEPAVSDLVRRGEIGRVRIAGVEIERPVYICTRMKDDEIGPVAARFLDLVLGRKA